MGDLLHDIIQLIEFLAAMFVACVLLLIVIAIVIAFLPKGHPIRELLVALAKPVGVMVGAEALAIPLELLPPIEALYDIAALLFVGYQWLRFFAALRDLWPDLVESFASKSPAEKMARQQFTGSQARQASPALTGEQAFSQGLAADRALDYQRAFTLYTRAVELGHAGAMNEVGRCHQDGKGVPRNYALAAEWYEKAVAAGERKYAFVNLNRVGVAYQTGKHVNQDLPKAARLYEISAKCGHPAAQFNLGVLYRNGWGVPKNAAQARHWLGLSAQQGDEDARKALADMDAQGRQEKEEAEPPRNGRMTRAAALEILDLKEGVAKPDMKAAWIRLMQGVHPDKGGSNFFAKQLNEAREVLQF